MLIDPLVLESLPPHFISDGMGEVIKYGCIKDADLFRTLCSHRSFEDLKPELPSVIARCVDIKRTVVEADQFDTGERMLLNFGHTLAHTIEQHYCYERESHGEAVGIGMYQITKMAEGERTDRAGAVQRRSVKPSRSTDCPPPRGIPVSALTEAISLDKKNLNGHLNVVLLHKIGDSYVYPTDVTFFGSAGEI